MSRQLVTNPDLKNVALSTLSGAGPVAISVPLTLPADPTQPLQACTKQYADTKLTQAAADARYLTQAQGDARYLTPAQAVATYLPLTGGTLAGPGNLTVNGNVSVAGTLALSTANTGINIAGHVALGDINSGDMYMDAVNVIRFRSAGGVMRGQIDAAGTLTMNGTIIGTAGVQSNNGYMYINNGAAQAMLINDGTNVYYRTPATNGTIYLQNNTGVNAFWANTTSSAVAGDLQITGTLQVRGFVIYMESSNQVLIRYRGDLGAIEVPYGNGIVTTSLKVGNYVYFEASGGVYLVWRGDLGTLYSSYPMWIAGSLQTATSITTNMNRGSNVGINFHASQVAWDVGMFVESGNIYWWPTSPSANYFFQANGNLGWGTLTAAAFTVASAAKDKLAIRTLDDPLSIVLDDRVHGISYMDRLTSDRRIGFVANEWLAVVPEIVSTDALGQPLGMDYARVGAITFEALKQYAHQTDARLDALEAKLAA